MIPAWFPLLTAFLFGAAIGSFLNVCIYRLPLGQSIVFPPSRCPSCERPIRPWDNIPMVSWVVLRGRCRDCGGSISPVYPLVEFLTAALFTLYTWRLGAVWTLLPMLMLVSAMIVIIFIDLEQMIIPNVITFPGMAAGLAFTPLLRHSFLDGVLGLLGGGLFFLLVWWVSLLILRKEGMGLGDVKMAAMMGAFLGWQVLLVAVFLALLSGSAVGVVLLATGARGRRDPIPFGPFLALGTLVAGLWGQDLLAWYIGLAS